MLGPPRIADLPPPRQPREQPLRSKALEVLVYLIAVGGQAPQHRLGRDYYVRVDTVDYSVDPRFIGRLVDVTASPQEVTAVCDGHLAARHIRSWAKQEVVTDPAHRATAAQMRQALALDRQSRQTATRQHTDGHTVMLRALPDYDALFGVDFNPSTPVTKASNE